MVGGTIYSYILFSSRFAFDVLLGLFVDVIILILTFPHWYLSGSLGSLYYGRGQRGRGVGGGGGV